MGVLVGRPLVVGSGVLDGTTTRVGVKVIEGVRVGVRVGVRLGVKVGVRVLVGAGVKVLLGRGVLLAGRVVGPVFGVGLLPNWPRRRVLVGATPGALVVAVGRTVVAATVLLGRGVLLAGRMGNVALAGGRICVAVGLLPDVVGVGVCVRLDGGRIPPVAVGATVVLTDVDDGRVLVGLGVRVGVRFCPAAEVFVAGMGVAVRTEDVVAAVCCSVGVGVKEAVTAI